jgi:putative cell wall-binding protein
MFLAVALVGAALVPGTGATHAREDEAADSPSVYAGDVSFSVARLAGDHAPGTAAAASRRFFSPGVPAAVVLSSSDVRGALAAGPAADQLGGPVLYTSANALPSATRDELERLRPERIFAIGDVDAISSTVLVQLDGISRAGATRISGSNR